MEALRETFLVFYTRFFVDFQAPEADLTGRVCLVTGANTGVGYQAAVHLAKRNASTLIFGVRSISKGQAAAKRLYEECTAYRGKVEVWELDMARFESVVAFGKRCKSDVPRLDVAILNAGCLAQTYTQTSDGWEPQLQVNVLSTGLLGMALLPTLARSASDTPNQSGTPLKPHLTIVSSDTQYLAAFKCRNTPGRLIDALNDPKNFGFDQYSMTKLLEMYLVREMAKLPIASEVVVNAVNPGLTTSELRRDAPRIFQLIFGGLAWSTEKGSRNHIYAALTDTSPGAFINCCKEKPPAELVRNAEGQALQKKLWSEVQEIYQPLLSK